MVASLQNVYFIQSLFATSVLPFATPYTTLIQWYFCAVCNYARRENLNLRWLYDTIPSVFAGSLHFSRCSGTFSPVKISGFNHSFKYVSSYALLPLQLLNSVFHGNQRMIHLLIPSLLASFKRVCPNFARKNFAIFCVKKRETPKFLLVKLKQILYISLANFAACQIAVWSHLKKTIGHNHAFFQK